MGARSNRFVIAWDGQQVGPDANMWTTLLVVFPNRSVARHLKTTVRITTTTK